MKKLWNRIIDIGIHEGLSPLKAKYIRLANGIAFLTMFIILSLLPLFLMFLPDTLPLIINLLVCIFLYLPVFLFNHWRKYTLAKTYILLNALLNTVVGSLLVGGETNFYFYIFPILLVAYFIFDETEKVYQYSVILFASAIFLGLLIWFLDNPALLDLPPQFLYLHRLNSHFGILLLLSGLFYYVTWSYRQAEFALEEERIKLDAEKKKSEALLFNILPVPVAHKLRENHDAIADGFQNVTILFSDIVGFTSLSARMNPEELVTMLNQIFSKFDHLMEREGLEKIKTIGDAYMVASGLPIVSQNHAETIAELALEMQKALKEFNIEQNQNLDIRIGIHSGPVVAGVIGFKKFVYDVWGDTVNTASRMESHGIPGKIHVSEDTYLLLKDHYVFSDRGSIDVKGKGPMNTYLLEASK